MSDHTARRDAINEAFAPFDAIRDAIKKAIDPLGVDLVNWSIMPGEDPHDDRASSIIFTIRSTAFETDQQREDRKTFEQIEQGEKALAAEDRLKAATEAARDELLNIGKREKGIFDEKEEVPPGE